MQIDNNEQINKVGLKDLNHSIAETIREDVVQREQDILQQEQKIQSTIFTCIYENRMKKEVKSICKHWLFIALTNARDKALLREIMASKLKMPDITAVIIDEICDSDRDLAKFLTECIPDKLNKFSLNYSRITDTPIKAKFYMSGLLKAVRTITKEVTICCFELSTADLQLFIRAACNAEQIVMDRCSIHCSAALDFGSKIKYSTRSLSFQWCGDTLISELTTDWKADPSYFSHIIDAIGNSGLRHSLTQIDISFNPTLNRVEVQDQLNACGMEYILVIQEDPSIDEMFINFNNLLLISG